MGWTEGSNSLNKFSKVDPDAIGVHSSARDFLFICSSTGRYTGYVQKAVNSDRTVFTRSAIILINSVPTNLISPY